MLLLDDLILDEFGEAHRQFKDLIGFMMKIDPKDRPTAA